MAERLITQAGIDCFAVTGLQARYLPKTGISECHFDADGNVSMCRMQAPLSVVTTVCNYVPQADRIDVLHRNSGLRCEYEQEDVIASFYQLDNLTFRIDDLSFAPYSNDVVMLEWQFTGQVGWRTDD